MDEKAKIAIFSGKEIRITIYKNEWWFAVIDIVASLTDSINPRDYWYKMKIRVKDEDGVELSTKCRQFNSIFIFNANFHSIPIVPRVEAVS